MFNFNLIGLAMTLGCATVGHLIAEWIGHDTKQVAMSIAGLMMLVIDAPYRWRFSPNTGWKRWFYGQGGGWLVFPVWFLGILFVIVEMIKAK